MKQIVQIMRLELTKAFRNKTMMIWFLICLFLTAFSVGAYASVSLLNNVPSSGFEEVAEYYTSQRDYYLWHYQMSIGMNVEPNRYMPHLETGPALANTYKKEADYFQFLLDNQLIAYKTILIINDYDEPFRQVIHENYQVPGMRSNFTDSMFSVLDCSTYILFILSFLATFWLFDIDKTSGLMKNILASPVNRKSVYIGKLLFTILCELVILLPFVTIGLLFGLENAGGKVLLYLTNGTYIAESAIQVYLSRFLSLFILMGCSTIIMSVLLYVFKKARWSVIVTIATYLILFTVYYILYDQRVPVDYYKTILCFPLIGLQYSLNGFKDYSYYIVISAHLVLFSILAYFGMKRFEKYSF